jgi:hypothetical protein
MEIRAYDINKLIKTAKYLIEVEDRIPPGLFAYRRVIFENVIDFYRALLRWKKQGYLSVEIIVPPDPPANVNQPFVKYYLWIYRLSNMLAIQPSMKVVNNDLVF